MYLKYLLLLTLLLFSIGQYSNAQNMPPCGITDEDQYQIREQMFRNRNQIPIEQIQQLQKQRFTIYIPTVIHMIGDSVGNSVVAPQGVLGMMCRLNEDFADQNIQFYIKDSLRYLYDNIIHADAYDSVAIDRMITYKDTTALNIFINSVAGGGVAGYYSRRGDFVFMLNPYATYSSPTITHELGHFFTLPHTFFGWEGTDAPSLYSNTPAPDSVGTDWRRREVEYVARSGSLANCYGAADGFCDTEADYLSFRLNCPSSYNVLDPSGTAIAPDHRLYMSYFADNCMDSFSNEQKVAMMSDIIDRNWTGFPGPASAAMINGNNIQALNPPDAAVVSGSPSDLIRLEWDTVGASNATQWIVEVERLFSGIPVEKVVEQIVVGQNYVDIPLDLLGSGRSYRWRVLPFSTGYFCANYSPYFNFSTANILGLESPSENLLKLQLFPNPVRGSWVKIQLKSWEASTVQLQIYAADGRSVYQEQLEIDPGESQWQLDLQHLPSGIYQLVVQSPKGLCSQRFHIIH